MGLIKEIAEGVVILGAAYVLSTSTADAQAGQPLDSTKTKYNLSENYVRSENSKLSVTQNGAILQDTTTGKYVFPIELTPNTKMDLREYFGISCLAGNKSEFFVTTPGILRNNINNIGDCCIQTREEKILEGIVRDSTFADESCGKTLDDALKYDGVIKPGELYDDGNLKIQDGIYVLGIKCPRVTKQFKSTALKNSITVLVHFYDNGKRKGKEQDKLKTKPEKKEFADKPEKKHPELKLIADGTFGLNNNGLIGARLGVQYGRVALLMNYSQRENELVREVTAPLSNGRSGYGREDETNLSALGPLAEIHAGHFFACVGTNFGNHDSETLEQIKSENGEVIKQNTNSKAEHEMSTMGYAGAEIPLGDGFSLRILGGGDDRNGAFGGAGFSYSLTHNKDKK